MKKYLIPIVLVVAFGAYVAYTRLNGSQEVKVGAPPPTASSGSVPPLTPPHTPAPTVQPSSDKGHYKDGSYTGDVTDAFYGPYQVKAVIQGGKLADVIFLQYPSDRQTSVRINTEAMPILKSEAIAAQNAQVDIVSGATQSSEAFMQSLASALALAQ